MKKQYQLLSCLLFSGAICMAQAKYWANNMRLYPVDSCKKSGIQFSLGLGTSTPIKTIQTSLNTLKTMDLVASVYLPIGNQKDQKNERITYGLHIGLAYAMGYGNYSVHNSLQGYNVSGQRRAPLLTAGGAGDTNNVILSFDIGPKANLQWGRFSISPTLGLGFLQMQQEGYQVKQMTTVMDGTGLETTIKFNRYAQGATKTFGSSFFPKLQASYNCGQLAFWTECRYVFGPMVKRDIIVFLPQGAANPVTNSYTLNQIQLGTTVGIESEQAKYQTWSIGAGIGIKLRRKCTKLPTKCLCAQ